MGTRKHLRTFSLSATGLLLAAAACTRERPTVEPAAPDLAAPAPSPGAPSRFNVPIEYDMTAVLRTVEEVVPTTFGSMQDVKQMGDDDRRHYAFEAKRGRFTAFARGSRVHLRATLTYSARGWYKPPIGPTLSAACGEGAEKPRVVVELATPLSLGAGWHLKSDASIVSIAPASTEARDRCEVSIFHRDVTENVVQAARAGLASQLPMIDRKIGAVDLSGHVNDWWRLLSAPIRLTDGVWLLIAPEQLNIGRVRGESTMLTIPVGLVAHPSIITSPTEPEIVPRPLPPLSRDSAPNGFHVTMDGVVDYKTASDQLTSALKPHSFTQASHRVTVTRADVLPLAKGRLQLSLVFDGDVRGVVVFKGTPRIEHARGEVTVPDLDFDLDSDSKVLETYSWLRAGDLRDELRRHAHFPIAAALDRGRALLLDGLNRKLGDAVTLSGTVDSVSLRQLFVTRDGLIVRADASGRAGMAVKQR